MIKKYNFLLAFLMISTSTIFSQQLENSTLWEISGNGLKQSSYLFGTIHISCDATLSDEVKKALDKTGQLVLEIDMDDPALQSKMMAGLMMKEGKTIKDFVSEEEYIAIDSLFIKNLGMSVNFMQNMKPSLLSAAFYPNLIDCSSQSFETELMKVAKEQGEEVKGLETIEDQMQVFDDIPYEDQVKDLIKSAKDNLAKDRVILAKMLEVYKNQDITKMLEMTGEESSSISDHLDKLLYNRNKKWIPRIGIYAKEKPTFFGVGAGHLAGENGVILLLRKAGYTVTPVQQ